MSRQPSTPQVIRELKAQVESLQSQVRALQEAVVPKVTTLSSMLPSDTIQGIQAPIVQSPETPEWITHGQYGVVLYPPRRNIPMSSEEEAAQRAAEAKDAISFTPSGANVFDSPANNFLNEVKRR